jgi:hypothetical protein
VWVDSDDSWSPTSSYYTGNVLWAYLWYKYWFCYWLRDIVDRTTCWDLVYEGNMLGCYGYVQYYCNPSLPMVLRQIYLSGIHRVSLARVYWNGQLGIYQMNDQIGKTILDICLPFSKLVLDLLKQQNSKQSLIVLFWTWYFIWISSDII